MQMAKVTRQPTTTVEKMAIPAARFSHMPVHVDIVGPLPSSREGYTPPHHHHEQVHGMAGGSPAKGHCFKWLKFHFGEPENSCLFAEFFIFSAYRRDYIFRSIDVFFTSI